MVVLCSISPKTLVKNVSTSLCACFTAQNGMIEHVIPFLINSQTSEIPQKEFSFLIEHLVISALASQVLHKANKIISAA